MAKKTSTKIHFNKLWLAVALLAVLQVATLYCLVKLNRISNDYGDFNKSVLINAAEFRRYKEPVIAVGENRVYLPELKVFVPLGETSRDVRYDVRTPVHGSAPENVYLSLSGVIGRQTDAEDATCDKMVRISVAATPDESEELVGEISPAQSGLRYVFKHNDCQIYTDGSIDKLVDVAKSVQQY